MAGIVCTAVTNTDVLVGPGAECVLAVYPASANHRIKVLGFGIYFEGVTVTGTPMTVQLMGLTGVSGDAATISVNNKFGGTIKTTGVQNCGANYAATTSIFRTVKVHNQSGYEVLFPLGQEVFWDGNAIPANGAIGLLVSDIEDADLPCRAHIIFEE